MRKKAVWCRQFVVLGASVTVLALVGAMLSGRTAGAVETSTTKLRSGYVGDAACVTCHLSQTSSYVHTAHQAASHAALPNTVLGAFASPQNVLKVMDPLTAPDGQPLLPTLSFRMERRGDQFFETALTGWDGNLHQRKERIDVVTGSGVRGQTYLYWQDDRLYELPVSYWSEGQRWINSPGYVDGTADFVRPVNPGCLECHATYIQATSDAATTNTYVKDTFVAGIGCESCHGAGAAHAAKYSAMASNQLKDSTRPMTSTDETLILNPAKFSRDRQIDSCAYCHGGTARTALKPAFSFAPGKLLSEFFLPLPMATPDHPDVHGNQVGLLERSKCFQKSANMSCSTCHDVHAPEKVAASYSEKCLSCHSWQSCGVAKTHGIAIKKNCVDCHMPVEATNLIVSETGGHTVRARMRNHWIKVYPMVEKSVPAGL